MRSVFYHILLFLFASVTGFSQHIIQGKVLDDLSGNAIAGASIYFNNTSLGTTSDAKGQFSFSAENIRAGDLIISSIGFETLSYAVNLTNDKQKTYSFRLVRKEPVMQDIMILPDAVRRRYLRYFVENFLGITEEAERSKLENLSSIYFVNGGKDKNSFFAYSDTPLVIINRRLGYRIHFQLEEFYFSETGGTTSFFGFTRYEEMGEKKRFEKNRRKVYLGSTMHFYRSLISNTLEKESFALFLIRKDTLKIKDGISGRLVSKPIETGIPVTALGVVGKDSTDSSIFVAKWPEKMMVQYNKEPASKKWISQRRMVMGNLPNGFRAYLTLRDQALYIDKYGILLNPLSVWSGGYWIYEKAASMLPYNYQPDKE